MTFPLILRETLLDLTQLSNTWHEPLNWCLYSKAVKNWEFCQVRENICWKWNTKVVYLVYKLVYVVILNLVLFLDLFSFFQTFTFVYFGFFSCMIDMSYTEFTKLRALLVFTSCLHLRMCGVPLCVTHVHMLFTFKSDASACLMYLIYASLIPYLSALWALFVLLEISLLKSRLLKA